MDEEVVVCVHVFMRSKYVHVCAISIMNNSLFMASDNTFTSCTCTSVSRAASTRIVYRKMGQTM